MFQRWPNGSLSCPWRSPQNESASWWRASAPASTARAQRPSASSVLIWRTVAVPPTVSGETMPMSGNSLPTCTTESPKASSTVITLSPGSGMRLSSRAPNAFAYQPAASAASRTTMCAAMFIAETLRQRSADVFYVRAVRRAYLAGEKRPVQRLARTDRRTRGRKGQPPPPPPTKHGPTPQRAIDLAAQAPRPWVWLPRAAARPPDTASRQQRRCCHRRTRPAGSAGFPPRVRRVALPATPECRVLLAGKQRSRYDGPLSPPRDQRRAYPPLAPPLADAKSVVRPTADSAFLVECGSRGVPRGLQLVPAQSRWSRRAGFGFPMRSVRKGSDGASSSRLSA